MVEGDCLVHDWTEEGGSTMTRWMKILAFVGLGSSYIIQLQCTKLEHGYSVLTNIGKYFTWPL